MKTLALAIILTLTAQTNAQTNVRINREKVVRGTALKIKFVELLEDSRCPADALCVWAGNAKIKVKITKRGAPPETIELNTLGPGTTAQAHGHTFKLQKLTPYPRSNIRINRNGFMATIAVSKQ